MFFGCCVLCFTGEWGDFRRQGKRYSLTHIFTAVPSAVLRGLPPTSTIEGGVPLLLQSL